MWFAQVLDSHSMTCMIYSPHEIALKKFSLQQAKVHQIGITFCRLSILWEGHFIWLFENPPNSTFHTNTCNIRKHVFNCDGPCPQFNRTYSGKNPCWHNIFLILLVVTWTWEVITKSSHTRDFRSFSFRRPFVLKKSLYRASSLK